MLNLKQVQDMKPKEVCMRKVSELTDEAFEFVHDAYEINNCDCCGDLESTHELVWICEGFEPRKNEFVSQQFMNAYWDSALCESCYLKEINAS